MIIKSVHKKTIFLTTQATLSHIQANQGRLGIFRTLHMQQNGLFVILEYSEPFYDCIQMHFQNPVYLRK